MQNPTMVSSTLGEVRFESLMKKVATAIESKDYLALHTYQIYFSDTRKELLRTNNYKLCAKYFVAMHKIIAEHGIACFDALVVLRKINDKQERVLLGKFLIDQNYDAVIWMSLHLGDYDEDAEELNLDAKQLKTFIDGLKGELFNYGIDAQLPSFDSSLGRLLDLSGEVVFSNMYICFLHLQDNVINTDYKKYAENLLKLISFIEVHKSEFLAISDLQSLFGQHAAHLLKYIDIKVDKSLTVRFCTVLGAILALWLSKEKLMSQEEISKLLSTTEDRLAESFDLLIHEPKDSLASEPLNAEVSFAIHLAVVHSEFVLAYSKQDVEACFTALQSLMQSIAQNRAMTKKILSVPELDSIEALLLNIVLDPAKESWVKMLALVQYSELEQNDPSDLKPVSDKKNNFKQKLVDRISFQKEHFVIEDEPINAEDVGVELTAIMSGAIAARDAESLANVALRLITTITAYLKDGAVDKALQCLFMMVGKKSAAYLLMHFNANKLKTDDPSFTQNIIHSLLQDYYQSATSYSGHKDFGYVSINRSVQANLQFAKDLSALQSADAAPLLTLTERRPNISYGEIETMSQIRQPRIIAYKLNSEHAVRIYANAVMTYFYNLVLDDNPKAVAGYADKIVEISEVLDLLLRSNMHGAAYGLLLELEGNDSISKTGVMLASEAIASCRSVNYNENVAYYTARLLICIEALVNSGRYYGREHEKYCQFKSAVYNYWSTNIGADFTAFNSVDEFKRNLQSASGHVDSMLQFAVLASNSVTLDGKANFDKAVSMLVEQIIKELDSEDGNYSGYSTRYLHEIQHNLHRYLSANTDGVIGKQVMWNLLRDNLYTTAVVPFDMLQQQRVFVLSELEQDADFFVYAAKFNMLANDAYQNLDAETMALAAKQCIAKLNTYMQENPRYSSAALATAALSGFGLLKKDTRDLVALLQEGMLPQAALYLVQNYRFANRFKVLSREETKKLEKNCVLWLKDVAGKLVAIDPEQVPTYAAGGSKLALWKVYMNHAQQQKNVEMCAQWLQAQVNYFINAQELGEALSSSTNNKLLVKEIVHVAQLARSKDASALAMKLYHKFYRTWSKYSGKIRVIDNEPEVFKLSVLMQLKVPFEALSLADAETLTPEAIKVYAQYTYDESNKGVDFTQRMHFVEVMARLNPVMNLRQPQDSDSKEYKYVYKLLTRMWWDHLLAHRFGISGKGEFDGLKYNYDGSVSKSMLEQLKDSVAAFVADRSSKIGCAIELDKLTAKVAAINSQSCSEKELVGKYLANGELDIAVLTAYATNYDKDPFYLPTNLANTGHATGAVLFNYKDQNYCMLLDRGDVSQVADLASLGITIYKVTKPLAMVNFAATLAASWDNFISPITFAALKESLGLEQCHFISKKWQKAGNCAFSSCAKLLLQSIVWVELFKQTGDFVIATEQSEIFYKAFTAFDRARVVDQYLQQVQLGVITENRLLLTRVELACQQKPAHAPVLSFLATNNRSMATETELQTAKEQQNQHFVKLITAFAGVSVDNLSDIDMGQLRTMASEYAELHRRHAPNSEMQQKFMAIIESLNEKYGVRKQAPTIELGFV